MALELAKRCACGRRLRFASSDSIRARMARRFCSRTCANRARATPATARFWTKVAKGSTMSACWLWLGARQSRGYGQLDVGGRRVQAHRFAYELLVGPIAADLTIDHLCNVKACVNPAHLEPVTRAENSRRGAGPRNPSPTVEAS